MKPLMHQISEAMSSYESKQASGATWLVGKPGRIPIYEVTDENEARQLAKSLGPEYSACKGSPKHATYEIQP